MRDDLSVFIPNIIETLFIEYDTHEHKREILGVVYKPNTPPKADLDIFTNTIHELMEKINEERWYAVIMGNMNIDVLQYNNHDKTIAYIDEIFTYGFLPTITKPTHISHTSSTLIDHIYSNDYNNFNKAGIIITDVADHYGTFYLKHKCNPKPKGSPVKHRRITSKNIDKFIELLLQTDFMHIMKIQNVNDAYNEFTRLFMCKFDLAFPLKPTTKQTKYLNREPWISKGIICSSKIKHKLFVEKQKKS